MTNEKLAYLRMTVALSLPQIKRQCPEAHARLTKALEETIPSFQECAVARPQVTGQGHYPWPAECKSDDEASCSTGGS